MASTQLSFPGPRLTSGQQELVRWVAMAAMVVDHVGAILLTPDVAGPLRFVGRIAWPLFAFLMAYNVAVRGVDPRRYFRPLLLWGAVAQLPHYLALGQFRVSILGTLLLSAAAIALLQAAGVGTRTQPVRGGSSLAFVVAGLVGVVLLAGFVEYGLLGVFLVLALWWALYSNSVPAWGLAVLATALVNFPWANWPAALLALPVMYLAAASPVGIRRSGWLPWLFYPAHLLVLWLVRLVL